MLLGAHESIKGGYDNSIFFGSEDGCEAIQIFTKNQRFWKEPEISEEERKKFKEARKKSKIKIVIAHDSYLVNLASPDEQIRRKSITSLMKEMERCERLQLPYLVMHPGAHMGQGEQKGLELIAEGLGEVLGEFKSSRVKILLETTAGQGSNLGYKFEHLRWIIRNVRGGKSLGVCFDTCHSFSAGYDISTVEGYEKTFQEFDRVIGLKYLHAIHLNDSKKDCGSRVDRHEHIGKGKIGVTAFKMIVKDRRFKNLPGILETPPLSSGDRGYRENLKILRGLLK